MVEYHMFSLTFESPNGTVPPTVETIIDEYGLRGPVEEITLGAQNQLYSCQVTVPNGQDAIAFWQKVDAQPYVKGVGHATYKPTWRERREFKRMKC